MPDPRIEERPPGFSVEVEARAVESAQLAAVPHGHPLTAVPVGVVAAAPVIAEAGYREGSDDGYADGKQAARSAIEAAIVRFERQRDRANWNDPFREGKAAGFRAALAVIDKEGEGE